MSNVTQINLDLNNGTIINNQIEESSNATVINTDIVENQTTVRPNESSEKDYIQSGIFDDSLSVNNSNLTRGTIICEKYVVREKLNTKTGEADLYICEYAGRTYIAKIYRRNVSIKQSVTYHLKKISSPYVAKIFATGEINGFPVEIQPYYKHGSLQGKTFTFEELKSRIIPCLNEGLKVLHQNNIVHKDLKPGNIMDLGESQGVAIIDFGISSILETNNTVVVTKTGFTPDYSAPETFKNLFYPGSDYYSLGITLYELFTGKTPYSNLSKEEIERYLTIQKLPLPESMPEELKSLIKGLTYSDIKNRDDAGNPNRRWGYDEVVKWLNGEELILPGESKVAQKPFRFLNKEYLEKKDLVEALAQNWASGKKVLFRSNLSDFYHGYDDEAESICLAAEDEAVRLSGQDDIIYWSTLYKLDKSCQKLFWKGFVFNSLPDLGRSLLDDLWSNANYIVKQVDEMLCKKILSRYLAVMKIDNEELRASIATLEQSFEEAKDNNREKEKIYYILGYMLSGQRLMRVGNESFRTLNELTDRMKELQEVSFEKLQPFCHKLIEDEGVLEPQFEAWLIMMGKKDVIDQWQGRDYFFDDEGDDL